MDKAELKIIEDFTLEFFSKMTFSLSSVKIILDNDSINIIANSTDPQVLIGEKGSTLSEIQKILRMALSKKLGKVMNINLDVNGYKDKRIEHLKRIAKETAQEVIFSKMEKSMFPMSSFERKIIHAELADNSAIKTESRGNGLERYVVVMPK